METKVYDEVERSPAGRRGRPPAHVPKNLLAVEVEKDGMVVTLRIQGQLDLNTVLTFRDAVFSAMGERPEQLILDLSGIRTIDSAGISALITVCRVSSLVRTDTQIVPSAKHVSLLAEMGLDRLFKVIQADQFALS